MSNTTSDLEERRQTRIKALEQQLARLEELTGVRGRVANSFAITFSTSELDTLLAWAESQ